MPLFGKVGVFLGIVLVSFTSLVVFGNYVGPGLLGSEETLRPSFALKSYERAGQDRQISEGITSTPPAGGSEDKIGLGSGQDSRHTYRQAGFRGNDSGRGNDPTSLKLRGASNGGGETTLNDLFYKKADEKLNKVASDINKKIVSSIAALNPGEKEEFKVLNPESVLNEVIAKELAELEEIIKEEKNITAVVIDEEKIIKNGGTAASENYLGQFKSILKKNSPKSFNYNEILPAYEKTLAEFNNLKVPEELLSIHKKEIELLNKAVKIWRRIKLAADDKPIISLVALRQYQDLIDEYQELKINILAQAQTNKLNFQWD